MLITRRRAFGSPDEVHRETYGSQLIQEQVRFYETLHCWANATRHQLD